MNAEVFLESYLPLITNSLEHEYKLPAFTESHLLNQFTATTRFLKMTPTLIRITGRTIVVGDIHGNIRDLIRIISKNGLPNDFNYIFLVDYVEVLTLLCALQLSYPNNVFLLRGNHETEKICSYYGFKTEVLNCYGSCALFDAALEMFRCFSLAAIVNDENFLVHGGISCHLNKVSQIAELSKPISAEVYSEETKQFHLIKDMLWSDPSDSCTEFVENTSRGEGTVCYGFYAVKNFLKENHLERIIRGHSIAPNGVKCQFHGKVYTVFSSGCYCLKTKNSPGYLIIEGKYIETFVLDDLPQLKRNDVDFIPPVTCKSMAELHSSRRIGPGVINRYWSTKRLPPLKFPLEVGIRPSSSLPPINAKSHANLKLEMRTSNLMPSYDLVKFAIKRKKKHFDH